MQLSSYLAERGVSYSAFAKTIDISAEAIRRYALHRRIPRPDIMAKISAATGGVVQANDFFAEGAAAPKRRRKRAA